MFLYGSATSIKTIYHANHQYYNSHMRPVRLLSAALLLIISLTYLQAQESYPLSLVVEQSSQPEEVIPLTDIQKITFADGKMQMHYTQKANYSAAFACKDVTKCTFSTSKKPTALPLIASPVVSSYKLLSDGENIFIEGLVAGQGYNVALYDMQGNQIYLRPNFVVGETIHCATLPSGVYLVQIDGEAYRFIL